MTVTVSKPQLNLREELSALKKKSGIKGEELLRANTVADVYTSVNPVMFRNVLINGDMRISQRGDFTTDGTQSFVTNAFTVDRWRLNSSGAGTDFIQHVTTNQPSALVGSKSLKMTVKSTAVSYRRFSQPLEFPSQYNSKTYTLSFWYKAKSSTGNLRTGYWVDGTAYTTVKVLESTDTWTYVASTFTYPSSISTSVDINFGFNDSAGGSIAGVVGDYIEITGVQLERGTVATPFENRPIGVETLLCKRYYHYMGGTYGELAFLGAATSSTKGQTVYTYPVEMRAAPTVTKTGTWTWLSPAWDSSYLWTGFTTTFTNIRSTTIAATVASGLTTGYCLGAQCDSSPGSRIIFDAEL